LALAETQLGACVRFPSTAGYWETMSIILAGLVSHHEIKIPLRENQPEISTAAVEAQDHNGATELEEFDNADI
jgi:hypothetical protein